MNFILLNLFENFLSLFQNSGPQFYFYYDGFLLLAVLAGVMASAKSMLGNITGVGKRYGIAIILLMLAFLVFELLFVQPTNQLYNDEYIHMSIAKSILYDRTAAICSFSTGSHCVNGTSGIFQQPAGWATMLALSYLFFGVSFTTTFNLALLVAVLSIPLQFYIALVLIKNKNAALLSSFLLAATPLFITYSRSSVLEISELAVFLLSAALLLTYMKSRELKVGLAAVTTAAYVLTIKNDAIILLPILLIIFLFGHEGLENHRQHRKIQQHAALIFLLIVIITPQLAFLYFTFTINNFGANAGQQKFSIANLESNFNQNVAFWIGAYGSIATPYRYPGQNVEYPITYAFFALVGMALLAYRKRFNETISISLWFLIVFIFYASYYAGGALYNGGDDIRYFILAFPSVAILAASGALELHSTALEFIAENRKPGNRAGKKTLEKSHSVPSKMFLVLILAVLFADPLFEIATVSLKSPSDIYIFAPERFQQQIIVGNYMQIPNNCFVMSYETTLWNVLNKSSIYADWALLPQYKYKLMNLSRGCLYFESSLECGLPDVPSQYNRFATECVKIFDNFSMSPVINAKYDRYGWDLNFTIYKVNSFLNGTPLFK